MSTILHDEVVAHRQSGSWRNLERVALGIIAAVRQQAGDTFNPKLGGGTRLMLALDHRISHDIDLFIRDPQWIGYLSPRLNDRVEAVVSGYEEAADFLKLNLSDGEIDFIVRGSLLGLPDESSDDTPFPLEPVAEVLAKKLFYRGASLTPRDLFDWWAIETMRPDLVPGEDMARLLESKVEGIDHALCMLSQSQAAQNLWDGILAPDKPKLADVTTWAQEMLDHYRSAVMTAPIAPLEVRRLSEYRATKPVGVAPSPESPDDSDLGS